MSKTIEFVDEKIKMLNVAIESAVKIVKEFDGIAPVDSYKKLVEEHLKEIQTLEQIKIELEAWEITKENTMGDDFHYEINIYKSDKGYNKFKKGLEIEDGKNKFE